MNKVVIVGIVAVLLIGALLFVVNSQQNPTQQSASQKSQPIVSQTPSEEAQDFATPKKAAHFESNTPEHGITLAAVPVNVVINFNFDLVSGSSIQIIKQGVGGLDYGLGDTIIDANKLSIRRKMDPESPDQIYTVHYKACWADGSCHDGSFQFKINRGLSNEFIDQTNKKEVTINLQNIAFNPQKIKISKGTKITWVNQDSVEHTVNTDSHPAHTYYLSQNSRTLKKGDTYSVTFKEAGIYPYHCTPHAASMKGEVLVE